jgi:hypothetical protein
MCDDEPNGSLIPIVLAALIERVSLLEAQRPGMEVRVNKAAIRAEMVRLYLDPSHPTIAEIASRLGYSQRGVRNNLQAAGVYVGAVKKESA